MYNYNIFLYIITIVTTNKTLAKEKKKLNFFLYIKKYATKRYNVRTY